LRNRLTDIFRLIILTPLNLFFLQVFGKKCFACRQQRELWEQRAAADFAGQASMHTDTYYTTFDEVILKKIATLRSATYLEVGCYIGTRLHTLAAKVSPHTCIGMDLGFKNLALAKKTTAFDRCVHLCNANAVSLPFKTGSIETVYTIVCLTHLEPTMIEKALTELIRVSSKNLILVEIDAAPMKLRKKIELINWRNGYTHPYEKLLSGKISLVSRDRLYDSDKHPRYTIFHFVKNA